jgi:hypothetical protein
MPSYGVLDSFVDRSCLEASKPYCPYQRVCPLQARCGVTTLCL